MKNKRNYYRLLHVQADAPDSVIQASYRAMMQKLRLHPDLGGDEWNASLLNKARDTLLDPAARQAHDRKLAVAGHSFFRNRQNNAKSAAGGTPAPMDVPQSDNPAADNSVVDLTLPEVNQKCPFCRKPILWETAAPTVYPVQPSCTRCDSPLTPPHLVNEYESDGRRKINRTYFEFVARVWDHWPINDGYSAVICDWSTVGCGVELTQKLHTDQVVLLKSPGFDAVAMVRNQRPMKNDKMVYGLEYLSIEIRLEAGALISSAA